jgi:D-alanyl-D-alanine carboxypeptidase/D-alanyl-D-alanine-endopeptidase (penicillin-binding protein 4)
MTGVRGRIVGDGSYFDFLRSTSESGYQPDVYMEGELSGLAFDRGFLNWSGTEYQPHPALFAAQQFASALRAAKVSVPSNTPISSVSTPPGAHLLASVRSARISRLIELTNTPSDNFLAEMLLKGLGARFGSAGTTAAGAAIVRAELRSEFGIRPRLLDGSGLSRADSTSPRQVVKLLADMADNPDFINSLAVGGETGTLRDEMQGTRAQGNCVGKTGTLHDVANLSGICRARDGDRLAFAFLANGISDPDSVHSVEANDMAVALANYDG